MKPIDKFWEDIRRLSHIAIALWIWIGIPMWIDIPELMWVTWIFAIAAWIYLDE